MKFFCIDIAGLLFSCFSFCKRRKNSKNLNDSRLQLKYVWHAKFEIDSILCPNVLVIIFICHAFINFDHVTIFLNALSCFEQCYTISSQAFLCYRFKKRYGFLYENDLPAERKVEFNWHSR